MSLKIHVDFNLETLARQLIQHISEHWKTPFDSPIILFSDKKVEQWFRLFWLKENPQKNGVVMNLSCERFEDFLFSILSTEQTTKKMPLTIELLRDILIAKLSADCNGTPFYKTLGSRDVNTYLDSTDDAGNVVGINTIHLYDFAEQMAALFIDYEAQRPEQYDKKYPRGIISTWQSDEDFFAAQIPLPETTTETIRATEFWQRRLYRAMFADTKNDYITLPQLYYENLSQQKSCVFTAGKPVYLFGFAGMGQVYRTILRDFSEHYDLYVYLQGQTQTTANELAKKWNAFGAENIGWWLSQAPAQSMHIPAEKTDSVLHRMQAAIRTGTACQKARPDEDDSLQITAAATAVREVEYVHSKICALITEEHAAQSDILVLAPDISAYRTAILEVFDQNSEEMQANEDIRYPKLPYKIVDASAMESLVCNALKTLLAVAENGTISRPDFFAIVRNPFVQKVRGITTEQVASWSQWISAMHVYRNTDERNDWQQGLQRLLLARLTDTTIATQTDTFYPFSDLSSTQDASLNAFADCINDITALIETARADTLSKDSLDAFKNQLDRWLHYDDTFDTGFAHEQVIYEHAVKEIERQYHLFALGYKTILKKDFFIALASVTENARFGFGTVFTSGITFANFQPNRILSAKFVFFMGLDSKQFPGTDKKNVLDLRQSVEPWQCDVSVVRRNTYAFLCQIMATGKKLFISYVDKDIKKDESFYCSSVVNDVISALYLTDKKDSESEKLIRRITLDETRDWTELYTGREFRNKMNYKKLQYSGFEQSASEQPPASASKDAPDRTTISKLKKFLEDPFRFRAEQLFTSTDDKASEEIIPYEPIDLSVLQQYDFAKTIIIGLLRAAQASPDATLPEISPETIWNYLGADDEAALFNTGALPQKIPFGTEAARLLAEKIKIIRAHIAAIGIDYAALVFDKKISLSIAASSAPEEKKLITGTANVHWFSVSEAGKPQLDVLDYKLKSLACDSKNESKNDSAFLNAYLTALCLLAEKVDNAPDQKNISYSVTLHLCTENFPKKPPKELFESTSDITPQQAYNLLWSIYHAAFIEKYCVCVPVNFRKKSAPGIASLDDLNSEWGYFDKKDMVTSLADIGFAKETLVSDWEAAATRQNDWCRFLTVQKTPVRSKKAP